MSGNKWLNIEVAQNTMEVGDPLINFEKNVQMKKTQNPCKMNKSMQTNFQWTHLKILEKYIQIRNSIKISKHIFSMHVFPLETWIYMKHFKKKVS